jgi:sugar lactone lactonase YvrE
MTAASENNGQEAVRMMAGIDAEQRAAEEARTKDKAWKPACADAGLIQVGDSKNPGALKNFCVDSDGNVLACFVPKGSGPKDAPGIRVYSPKGALLRTLPLEIKAETICVAKDGSIFVAGDGRVQKLDAAGKVLASAPSPVAAQAVTIGKDTEEMVKQMSAQTKRPYAEELANMKTSLEQRRATVTGLAVTDEDVFMAVPTPGDYTFRVYRLSHALTEPKLVVDKLRGCCGQMDIQSHDGNLWIPHNARHAVESHDRDGKELTKFGTAGRVKASDFGGCCEPKNLRVLPDGDVLAAESGPPTCIKRFTADGKFKEVVALQGDAKGDCVRVTVEMSPDGHRYYLLDTVRDAIHIYAAKN